ncbi:MAG: O-antigen ligase family protein [bacterium]|nr:MAG: O-antigen ligase family protein [bacterium]
MKVLDRLCLNDRVMNCLLCIYILQLFFVAEYLRKIFVLNFGWGNIYPLRLYTVGFFAILVFFRCWKEKRIAVPHLLLFMLTFWGFIFIESLPFRSAQAGYSFIDMLPFAGKILGRPEPAYSFAKEQLYIYAYFLILVNYGLNKDCFYRVINYSLIAGILICAVTYIGYCGLIDINTDFRIHQINQAIFRGDHHFRPKGLLINGNHISYICAFSILFLIIKQRYENKFTKRYILRDILIILFLVSMPIINVSIGAAITSLILIPYYFFIAWRKSTDIAVKAVLIGIVLLVIIVVGPKISETNLVLRMKSYTFEKSERIKNLTNAWTNFKSHPFVGVGYNSAAINETSSIYRTNNQFVQLMASSGIFYFLIYLCYFFRFYIYKLPLLKRPEVLLALIMVLIHSMLRRPMNMFPIFGYIAAYFCTCEPAEKVGSFENNKTGAVMDK